MLLRNATQLFDDEGNTLLQAVISRTGQLAPNGSQSPLEMHGYIPVVMKYAPNPWSLNVYGQTAFEISAATASNTNNNNDVPTEQQNIPMPEISRFLSPHHELDYPGMNEDEMMMLAQTHYPTPSTIGHVMLQLTKYTKLYGVSALIVKARADGVVDFNGRQHKWPHDPETGYDALEEAKRNGDSELASLLIESPEVPEYNGDTAMHTAARAGDLGTIKTLLAAGEDPNAYNNDDETPLEVAAPEIIFRLIASEKSPFTITPKAKEIIISELERNIEQALDAQDEELFQRCRGFAAKRNWQLRADIGTTLFDRAATEGSTRWVNTLLKSGATPGKAFDVDKTVPKESRKQVKKLMIDWKLSQQTQQQFDEKEVMSLFCNPVDKRQLNTQHPRTSEAPFCG